MASPKFNSTNLGGKAFVKENLSELQNRYGSSVRKKDSKTPKVRTGGSFASQILPRNILCIQYFNVLNKKYGINSALMSTIHAYTASQALQDSPGGRKNRAGAQNAIPASTGAAKAVGKVIPELEGKIDGTAVRIPTITGSMTELYSVLDKEVTVEEVNAAMKEASNEAFLYNEDEIVSSDVIGVPAGSIFDATQTKVIEGSKGQLVKTVAWYDNEYGFVSNMVGTLEHFANIK